MGVFEFLKMKKGAPLTQLPALEESLAKLRAELKDVTSIVENHGQRRADLLLSDAADADIAKLDADVALAQIRMERLELAEIELEDRINGARDASERTKRAAELERAAETITEKTKALDGAVAALAAAYTDLVNAVPADSGVLLDADHITKEATREDIARAILASGLFTAAPAVFEMIRPRTRSARPACVERVLNVFVHRDGTLTRFNPGLIGEECSIAPAPEAAQQMIARSLRAQAARLRDSAPLALAAE